MLSWALAFFLKRKLTIDNFRAEKVESVPTVFKELRCFNYDTDDLMMFNFVLSLMFNRSKVNGAGKRVWILIMLGKQPKSV